MKKEIFYLKMNSEQRIYLIIVAISSIIIMLFFAIETNEESLTVQDVVDNVAENRDIPKNVKESIQSLPGNKIHPDVETILKNQELIGKGEIINILKDQQLITESVVATLAKDVVATVPSVVQPSINVSTAKIGPPKIRAPHPPPTSENQVAVKLATESTTDIADTPSKNQAAAIPPVQSVEVNDVASGGVVATKIIHEFTEMPHFCASDQGKVSMTTDKFGVHSWTFKDCESVCPQLFKSSKGTQYVRISKPCTYQKVPFTEKESITKDQCKNVLASQLCDRLFKMDESLSFQKWEEGWIRAATKIFRYTLLNNTLTPEAGQGAAWFKSSAKSSFRNRMQVMDGPFDQIVEKCKRTYCDMDGECAGFSVVKKMESQYNVYFIDKKSFSKLYTENPQEIQSKTSKYHVALYKKNKVMGTTFLK